MMGFDTRLASPHRTDRLRDSLPIAKASGAIHIPDRTEIDRTLTDAQKRWGDIANDYFRRTNLYPHIPYIDIGRRAVWIALNQTGRDNLWPSTAFALLEQETGGKDLFGADWGIIRADRIPFCHLPTTEERVTKLTTYIEGGGWSNGVGLTQPTYGPYVIKMEELGGGWKPHVQMYTGFNILNDLINAHPGNFMGALEAYNDGSTWNNPNNPYENEFYAKLQAWKVRLR